MIFSPFRFLTLKIQTIAAYLVVLTSLGSFAVYFHKYLSTNDVVLSILNLSTLILLEFVFWVVLLAFLFFYPYLRLRRKFLVTVAGLSPDTIVILKKFLKQPSMTMNIGPNNEEVSAELLKSGIIYRFEHNSSPYTYKLDFWIWKFLNKYIKKGRF